MCIEIYRRFSCRCCIGLHYNWNLIVKILNLYIILLCIISLVSLLSGSIHWMNESFIYLLNTIVMRYNLAMFRYWYCWNEYRVIMLIRVVPFVIYPILTSSVYLCVTYLEYNNTLWILFTIPRLAPFPRGYKICHTNFTST